MFCSVKGDVIVSVEEEDMLFFLIGYFKNWLNVLLRSDD